MSQLRSRMKLDQVIQSHVFSSCALRLLLNLPSEPHEKFPVSKRSALYFLLPPRVRIVWIRWGPNLVFDAGLPNSNFLFLRGCGRLPPVARLLCHVSLEIPRFRIAKQKSLNPKYPQITAINVSLFQFPQNKKLEIDLRPLWKILEIFHQELVMSPGLVFQSYWPSKINSNSNKVLIERERNMIDEKNFSSFFFQSIPMTVLIKSI